MRSFLRRQNETFHILKAMTLVRQMMAEVERVLAEIGASHIPQILVCNKADRLEENQRPRGMRDLLLMEGGRQSLSITLRRFDATALGALIALFERAVGLYAELVNVNAYDQPGVEAGKKAAALILALQERLEALLSDGQERSLQELQQALGTDSPESLFWILRHLCANRRHISARLHRDANYFEGIVTICAIAIKEMFCI
mgnify:CR=1 FL=1